MMISSHCKMDQNALASKVLGAEIPPHRNRRRRTRALAVELAPIRVNTVPPGVVKTPLWQAMPEADREALYRQMEQSLLVGHVGEPEEIAEAYLYLMRQTYGTGQVIVVDGGGMLV
jgi:NAD(P)-dependent dehydrogenase (short-subunit alcohol dehydrogenase family)